MKETLIMLGTGNATVTKCYNTCFAIQTGEDYLLVDTGGGNGILTQLEKAAISLDKIHHIFISHEHTDHLLGIVWLIRMIATKMLQDRYMGDLIIYCHSDLVETIKTICKLTLQGKFYQLIGERILFSPLEEGSEAIILNYHMKFFDIGSKKAKQFGFETILNNGKRFVFLGDEPYNEVEYPYAYQADWMLHEAFCLYSQREIFKPYEKHHSTVMDACKLATELEVKSLLLYHTEDKNLERRKELYLEEGQAYYNGNLFIPDDLERIAL